MQVADALGVGGPFALAGHDIDGAVAQHIAVHAEEDRVSRLALVNSVLYDSWPVPAVARYRDDPELVRDISPEEMVEQRRSSLRKATTRELSEAEEEDYPSPWRTEDGTRLVAVPGAGHIPMEDAPERVENALVDFFAGSSG